MNISVVGAGYVGLVTSACLAEIGHRVTTIEIDKQRLKSLLDGRLPLFEPGLEELVQRNVANGRLRFVGDYAQALTLSEVAFIAVPTPPLETGSADTSHVLEAAREIYEHAPVGLTLVVKSTVPVGTCDEVGRLAKRMDRPDVPVVSNPEFLRQGTAVRDFFEPDRIVVGARDRAAGERVAHLYAATRAPVVQVSRRSAELAKYAANALLATRISFMNEIAAVCDATGANVDEVARIVGMDERIGPHFLRAGLGWGGSCFPKDVLALASMATDHGSAAPILEAVLAINERQRDSAVEMIRQVTTEVDKPHVAVLGLAFKPDTDDLRGAPAIAIIQRLLESGMTVAAHDPVAVPNAQRALPGIDYAADEYATVSGADVVLLATEWKQYLELDWSRVLELMRGKVVVDGRNVLDIDHMVDLGFRYLGFGRGHEPRLVERIPTTAASAPKRSVRRKAVNRVSVAESVA